MRLRVTPLVRIRRLSPFGLFSQLTSMSSLSKSIVQAGLSHQAPSESVDLARLRLTDVRQRVGEPDLPIRNANAALCDRLARIVTS